MYHREGEGQMGVGVFVLRDENTLVPMQAASFASEDDFQRLLADFPALLAIKWIAIIRGVSS